MKPRWMAVGLVLGVCVFFSRSLTYGFYFDDRTQVLEGKLISNKGSVPRMFSVPVWSNVDEKRQDRNTKLDTYRPLFNLSLWIDHQKGGMTSWTFHSTNVLLHALVVVTLFTLLIVLEISPWIAFGMAVLFCVHPIAATPVHYVSARADSMAAWLSLIAVIAWIRAGQRSRWLGLAALAYGASLLCKETVVLLPLAWLAFRFPIVKKERIAWALSWFCPLALYGFMRHGALGSSKALENQNHLLRAFVNVPKAALHFLKQAVFPTESFPLIRFDPWGLSPWTILGSMSLLILGSAVLLFGRRRWDSRRTGGLLFAVLTLSPPVVAMVNTEVIDGHYLYMPILGLVIAGAPVVMNGMKRFGQLQPLLLAGLAFLSWQGFLRASAFESEISFYSAIVHTGKPAPVAIYNLGNAWMRQGQWSQAEAAYETYGRLRPEDERWMNNLGLAYFYQGRLPAAEGIFHRALEKNPRRAKTHFNLGLVLEQKGDVDEARASYLRAMAIDPSYADARKALDELCARFPKPCSRVR